MADVVPYVKRDVAAHDPWRPATGVPTRSRDCQFVDRWTGARYVRAENPDWNCWQKGWVWVRHPIEPFAAWHDGEVIANA